MPRPLALAALLALAGCSASAPPSPAPAAPAPTSTPARAWLDAVEAGDTEAAVAAVQAVVEAAGAEFPGGFGFDLAPYDEPINFYAPNTKRVTLGAAPTAAETERYWQIYSDRLTGGAWNPKAFFVDAEGAQRMASFNQAYLAAHEAGHALAYHYAVNPQWERVEEGGDRLNVHCQELLADRVAAGFLREVEVADDRAAALRARYLELMAAIDAEIPAAQRVRQTTLDGCETAPVLPVADEASFQRYVSAFFARQGLLLAGEVGRLEPVLDEHVRWRRPAFVAETPDLDGVSVSTVGPVAFEADAIERGRFAFLLVLQRDLFLAPEIDQDPEPTLALALSPDGSVHTVRMVTEGSLDTTRAEEPYTPDDIEVRTTLEVDGVQVPMPELEAGAYPGVISAAVLGEGDLLALVLSGDLLAEDDDGIGPNDLRLVRLRRSGDGWRAEAGPSFPRSTESRSDFPQDDVLVAPDGSVWVESADRLYAVDLTALAPTGDGAPIDADLGDLLALDAEGRRISAVYDVIGQMYPNGGLMSRGGNAAVFVRSGLEGAVTLAGSGFPGTADGAGPEARFGWIVAVRVVDGDVLVVQSAPGPIVRRISLP